MKTIMDYLFDHPFIVGAAQIIAGLLITLTTTEYIGQFIVLCGLVQLAVICYLSEKAHKAEVQAYEDLNMELRYGTDTAITRIYNELEAVRNVNKSLTQKAKAKSKGISKRKFVSLVKDAFWLKDNSTQCVFNSTRIIFVGRKGGVKELSIDGVRDSVAYSVHTKPIVGIQAAPPALQEPPDMPPPAWADYDYDPR